MSEPTREQIITAIKGSIDKWLAIVDGSGEDDGPLNCPLCRMFWYPYEKHSEKCTGCPIFLKTGERWCGSTPYEEYANADDCEETEYAHNMAINELEFLTELLAEWQSAT